MQRKFTVRLYPCELCLVDPGRRRVTHIDIVPVCLKSRSSYVIGYVKKVLKGVPANKTRLVCE
jgi:hypothetical protein